MSEILIEQLGTVMILDVEGELTYDLAVNALNEFYPFTACHVLWDLRKCSKFNISVSEYKELLLFANNNMTDRIAGKTAVACPNEKMYEMLMKLKALKETSSMPSEYKIFKEFHQALDWVNE